MKKHVNFERLQYIVVKDFTKAIFNGEKTAEQIEKELNAAAGVLAKMTIVLTMKHEEAEIIMPMTIGDKKVTITACVKQNQDIKVKKDQSNGK